ncbi:MAG: HNH endonuclease [Verrucomicrobia bacterium]|nr:HNH endonuclease [Verrucomicrobiota bacterium]
MAGRYIPQEIQRAVLVECAHRCCVCGQTPTEFAHIVPYAQVQAHEAENLLCLCPTCHTRADKEHWGAETLREYKRHPHAFRQPAGPAPATLLIKGVTLAQFESFGGREATREALAKFLQTSVENIIVGPAEAGSVLVTVRLTAELADKLERLRGGDSDEYAAAIDSIASSIQERAERASRAKRSKRAMALFRPKSRRPHRRALYQRIQILVSWRWADRGLQELTLSAIKEVLEPRIHLNPVYQASADQLKIVFLVRSGHRNVERELRERFYRNDVLRDAMEKRQVTIRPI